MTGGSHLAVDGTEMISNTMLSLKIASIGKDRVEHCLFETLRQVVALNGKRFNLAYSRE